MQRAADADEGRDREAAERAVTWGQPPAPVLPQPPVQGKRRVRCHSCEELFAREQINYGPCPFAWEIHGIDAPVWLCSPCLYQRAMDV